MKEERLGACEGWCRDERQRVIWHHQEVGQQSDPKASAGRLIVCEEIVAAQDDPESLGVKQTGKMFDSDWALMCRVQAGRIIEYRFFEDSAALVTVASATAVAP